jgi:hypothetical protein
MAQNMFIKDKEKENLIPWYLHNNAISKLIRLILFTDLSLDIYVYISNNVKALILGASLFCFC